METSECNLVHRTARVSGAPRYGGGGPHILPYYLEIFDVGKQSEQSGG